MTDFKKCKSYYKNSTILSGLIVMTAAFSAQAGEFEPTLDKLKEMGENVPASIYVVEPESPSLADFSYKDYSETPEVTRSYGVWLQAWDLSHDDKIYVGSSGVDISVPMFGRTEDLKYQVADPYDNVVSGDVTDEYGIFNGTDFEGKTFIDRTGAKEGGAIYAVDDSGKDVNAYFFNNKTNDNKGGAIYNGNYLAQVKGAFAGNQALGDGTGLGGAIYNEGNVGGVDADFFDNHAISESLTSGGAIFNEHGSNIGNISGNFVGNTAESTLQGIGSHVQSFGGAIYNAGSSSVIGDVTGHFVGNRTNAADAEGGAIYNHGSFGNITGDFIGNRAEGLYDYAKGGAIMNESSMMGNVTGDFISNTALATYAGAYGGAIANFNGPQLKNITGHFVGNKAEGYYAEGGALANYYDTNIEKITGNFINNTSIATAYSAYGGGISNSYNSQIGNIEGDFIGNQAKATNQEAYGGAISNFSGSNIGELNGNFYDNVAEGDYAEGGAISNYHESEIGDIKGQFVNNKVQAYSDMAVGGAIANTEAGSIENINADFKGNKAVSDTNSAVGGAIFNDGSIDRIYNSNFIDNSVEGDSSSVGGAIYTSEDLTIEADSGSSVFSGNTVNGQSNAIYVDEAILNLDAKNNGQIVFEDDLDGIQYDINLDGGAGENDEIVFAGNVKNVQNFNMTGNVITHLGENAVINTENMSVSGTGKLKIDIRPDVTAETTKSGVINVAEEVSGDYNVIVNALNSDGYSGANAVFVNAPNDANADNESFNVSRVISSPYMWEALRNINGTESGSVWYLALQGETPDPDPDPDPDPEPRPFVTPEVIAGIGMQQAGLDQTRSLSHSVSSKVASGRGHCPSCGIISYGDKKSTNIWAFAEGESLHSQRQVDAKGKIWGLTAGADLQSDYHNTLGLFASYRQGKYDFSGKGSHYSSQIGSQIDMDSYAGGLYYRYDRDMNWVFASLYGGYITSDVSTDDKIAQFDTDGLLMGASMEFGHDFAIANGLLLEPSLGLYYNQIDFDDAKDNVGKKYKWDGVRQTSIEAGLKLEKQFSHYSKLYIKPSIIKSYTYGDKVYITGLPSSDTIRNQILGRVEAGGRFGFTKDLSGYAWTNYTFGQHYDATAAGAGLNYSW